MAVKYYCPKCGRRFVDWGAEKLEYKCPSDTCESEELVLLGTDASETVNATQKVKRSKKRKAILPGISSDIDMPEMEDDFAEEVDLDDEDEELDTDDDDDDEEAARVAVDEADSEEGSTEDDDSDDIEDDETFSDAIDIDDDEFDGEGEGEDEED